MVCWLDYQSASHQRFRVARLTVFALVASLTSTACAHSDGVAFDTFPEAKSYPLEYKILLKKAKKGDGDAAFFLAEAHKSGDGLEMNLRFAYNFYKIAKNSTTKNVVQAEENIKLIDKKPQVYIKYYQKELDLVQSKSKTNPCTIFMTHFAPYLVSRPQLPCSFQVYSDNSGKEYFTINYETEETLSPNFNENYPDGIILKYSYNFYDDRVCGEFTIYELNGYDENSVRLIVNSNQEKFDPTIQIKSRFKSSC
jgi:hypothetical protein